MRFRRSSHITSYWDEGKLVFENFHTRVAVTAAPETASILSFFDSWRSPRELMAQLPAYSPRSVRRAIGELSRQTLLLGEGTPAARDDARAAKLWAHWLPHGSFHFSTRDTPVVPTAREGAVLRSFLAESPQPSFFKRYPMAKRVPLPPQQPPGDQFPRVLLARRTHRAYSKAPVPLPAISTLLYFTWGITGGVRSPVLGWLPRRTSPSGGARQPGEVYLLALRVQGLAPGLYHYDTRRHCLELLRRGRFAKRAVEYCGGQSHPGKAAALFLMTAVFPRVMWKYRAPRAYRIVLVDAGHLCQTFLLTATWLGLAPFSVMAISESSIERDLGIDGVSESVLYVAGVGIPLAPGARAAADRNRFSASL
ncbi:MAG TPA: SagB/ThcOx family dehydrogenase [Candidatus Acidoferrales bacterium]|nr:SagB/ThcOx family dehydrogenase [Candidatus Acidoferrales bacterium]